MTPERWQQVREVLEAALAIPGNERRAYLDKTCAHDPELRSEVESLLESHEHAGSLFLSMPAADVKSALSQPTNSKRVGSRIGVYQIEEEIGHGGMGEVYRAVRADGQYKKEVAIKLVRGGYNSAAILERFLQERQILASLDHPNIARLLDGGTTDEGFPYLVMELIEGAPIDQYCEEHSLDVNERLRLFGQVCAAVQYAHQRLVIHRDIKPSNILVTSEGVPKLLDFGIAKLLDSAAAPETTLLRAMTPEYASPEQIRGEPITTATDIYSLGVVLYRLLTGNSPYRANTRNPLEFARMICDTEPTKPSWVVSRTSQEGNIGSPPQSQRETRFRGHQHHRKINADLDNIVLKALRKEPARRYAAAEQFADDIRRHLQGLPVIASPDSFSYRARKFIGRNLLGVAAAVMVLIAIGGGVLATARQARIAEANRRRAEARFNDVRKLANSLIFEIHDSIWNVSGASAARKLILQRALEYLDSLSKESGNDPDLVRELAVAYERVGELQGDPLDANLGDIKGAASSLNKALELQQSLVRATPLNRNDQVQLAVLYLDLSEFQSGVLGNVNSGWDYARKAVVILDREVTADPTDFHAVLEDTRAYSQLGFLQIGNGAAGSVGSIKQGITDLQKALELDRRCLQLKPAHNGLVSQKAVILALLGDAMMKTGQRPGALDYYQRSAEVFNSLDPRGKLAAPAHDSAAIKTKIADVLMAEERVSEAIRWYRKGLQEAVQLEKTDSNEVQAKELAMTTTAQLGHALVEGGKVSEGLRYLRTALQQVEAHTPGTPLYDVYEGIARNWIGESSERRGRITDAIEEYRKSKAAMASARAAGANDMRTQAYYCSSTDRLAAALLKLDKTMDARAQYGECVGILEPLARANPDNAEVLYALAETYTGEGDVAIHIAEKAGIQAKNPAELKNACDWYQKSLNVWEAVPNPVRIGTGYVEVRTPPEVARKLTECRTQRTNPS